MIEDHYVIVSVESTVPPEHLAGTGWHRYVISQGGNTIHGYQQGSLETVQLAVEEIVTRLNERRLGKRGQAKLSAKNHGKKPAADST